MKFFTRVIFLSSLAAERLALADNCSALSDCYGTIAAAVLAAAAIALIIAVAPGLIAAVAEAAEIAAAEAAAVEAAAVEAAAVEAAAAEAAAVEAAAAEAAAVEAAAAEAAAAEAATAEAAATEAAATEAAATETAATETAATETAATETAAGETAAGEGAANDAFQGPLEQGAQRVDLPPNPNTQGMPAPEGFPSNYKLNPTEVNSFQGPPRPDVLPEGTKLYRVVGEGNNPAGSYWSLEPPPATEAGWRAGSAVRTPWNGDGSYVETTVGEGGLPVWRGPAAPQPAGLPGTSFPGGAEQIWVPPNVVTPSPPIPTPWTF